jgi:hypothetical protein
LGQLYIVILKISENWHYVSLRVRELRRRAEGARVEVDFSSFPLFFRLFLFSPSLFYLGVRGRGVEIKVKGSLDKGEHART